MVLHSIQVEVNKCLRMVSGCMASTSVPALHIELGLMPQSWRAKDRILKLVLRSLGRGPTDLVGTILWDYLGLGPLALAELGVAGKGVALLRESCLVSFTLRPVASTMGPWVWGKGLAGVVEEQTMRHFRPSLQIFTDASFAAESWTAGVGVVVPEWKLRYSWRVPVAPSAFLVELVAISVAIDLGLSFGVEDFVILSDSLAGIRLLGSSFRSMRFDSPVVLEVALKVSRAVQEGTGVKISWVRGHAGVWGNEAADECAKLALASGEGGQITVPYSARDLAPVVSAFTRSGWEREWMGEDRGRDLFLVHPSVHRPRELDRLPQRDAALLSRLRTGHVLLPGHAYEMGLAQSPWCRCGDAWGSVWHCLAECRLFDQARRDLRNVVGQMVNLESLLGVRPHVRGRVLQRLKAVVRFFRRIGLNF